jgi:hypothetical protein
LILLHQGVHHRHQVVYYDESKDTAGGWADSECCRAGPAAAMSSGPRAYGGQQEGFGQYDDNAAITSQGSPGGRINDGHYGMDGEQGGKAGHWRFGDKKDAKQLPPSYVASS